MEVSEKEVRLSAKPKARGRMSEQVHECLSSVVVLASCLSLLCKARSTIILLRKVYCCDQVALSSCMRQTAVAERGPAESETVTTSYPGLATFSRPSPAPLSPLP